MRDLGAEYLISSVGGAEQGAARISELLTDYRDAIQYIHDAVVRGINQEKTPDQLVEEIKLPPHLADIPELKELYGKISWSVSGIYEGYVGWFDGNATNLEPLTACIRAEKIIKLAGGEDKLVTEARNAMSNKEFQWAAEVADMLLAINPTNVEAREIKAEALFRLGESSYNSIARSYYFSQSQALRGKLEPPKPLEIDAEYAHTVDIDLIFSNLPIYFDPDAGANKLVTGAFKLTDTGGTYRAIVRKGVLEVRTGLPDQPDFVINIDSDAFKELMLGVSKPTEIMKTGRMKVEGSLLKLLEFFSLFKR
jgi:alkyl sulfatase BDS1-like metallo-beta-lactamase superfamily hydrolase